MQKHDDGAELHAIIRDIYHKQCEWPSVSPISMANEAMQMIHFDRELNELGYIGCHLQFRQIARKFCRKNFDPVERADILSSQEEMFPDILQERYPLQNKAGEEAEYVQLEHLPDLDGMYNVQRMRRASLALQKHSDALEAFILNRRVAA